MILEPNQSGRIPPEDVEAEKAVLGAIFLDPSNTITIARELLQPHSFYSPANERIFGAVLELWESRKPVDIITIREALRKRGELENVGGLPYLNELLNSVASTANIEAHCQIVAERYIQRVAINIQTEGIDKCYSGSDDVFELIDSELEKLDQLLAFRKQSKSITDAGESLRIYLDHIDRVQRGEVGMLATGFNSLDSRLSGGFQFGDSIVLAGNTGTGKSSFALQTFLNISRQIPAAYFSLEMSKSRMMARSIAQLGRIPIHNAQNPNTLFESKEDAKRYREAIDDIQRRQGRFFLDCTPDLTIGELSLRIEKLVRDHGVRFVVVDHVGKIAPDPKEKFQNREREIAHFSWKLTQLAIKHEIVTLTISPLNKEAENFTQPGLSHMRDSGMLSYDARTVLLLSNPMPDSTFGNGTERKATLQIAKQGDGESGISIELPFHAERGAYFADGLPVVESTETGTTERVEMADIEKGELPF